MKERAAVRRAQRAAAAAIKTSVLVLVLGIRPAEAAPPAKPPPQPKNIASLSLAQDFGIHEGSDVCAMRSQLEDGYACFRSSGTQYHGTPLVNRGGDVSLGLQPATTRLLAGFDRVLLDNISLGLRLGWVLRGGGPRPSGADAPAFLPFHAEARVAYTFGAKTFQNAGLRFSLFLDAGIAQVDTKYDVLIEEDTTKPPPAAQLDNPPRQTLAAYKKSGTGFFGGGAAATYAVTPSFGFSLALKLTKTFPSSGTLLSPELSGFFAF